uniref:Uncharacterized protein n=1 Tax=Acrobeloides nanus TaxID=290746 RepID=A0A914E6T3_9BILA
MKLFIGFILLVFLALICNAENNLKITDEKQVEKEEHNRARRYGCYYGARRKRYGCGGYGYGGYGGYGWGR